MQKARFRCAIPACCALCSFPYLGYSWEQVDDLPNHLPNLSMLVSASASFIMIPWMMEGHGHLSGGLR
jgi:hypothetical protein